jgi:transcriptional regulator with XRE-family HTH domain
VTLGAVLRKERELRGIVTADAAARLGIAEDDYQQLETGRSPAEKWGPLLARIAIALSVPTSRLVSETGKSDDAVAGQCGARIRSYREQQQSSPEQVHQQLEIARDEYEAIERGESPIEQFGPLLLRFAEMIEQPVFNLFYPCGLPLEKLDDYP